MSKSNHFFGQPLYGQLINLSDKEMPFDIIQLIESDETLSTCQMFNAEVCYGSGLVYDTEWCKSRVQREAEEFALDNDLASYSASRLSAALGKVQASLTLLSLARQLGYRYNRSREHDVFHDACALEPGRFCAGEDADEQLGFRQKRVVYHCASLAKALPRLAL